MERLRKTEDFSRVYRQGKSKADRNLVVIYVPGSEDGIRLGISVSKKVGNSVVRHRTKRRIREAARLHEESFPGSGDYVIIARHHGACAEYGELVSSLTHILARLKEGRT